MSDASGATGSAIEDLSYPDAFDEVDLPMAFVLLDGTYARVNPAFCRFLARGPEEIVGRSWREFAVDDLEAAEAAGIAMVQEPGRTLTVEARWSMPGDLPPKEGLATASVLRGADGDPRCVLVQLHDLSSVRRLEAELDSSSRELRATEDRYRGLMERLPIVSYAVDSAYRFGDERYVSPRIEQLLGVSVVEWYADEDIWPRLVHTDDRDRVMAAWDRFVQDRGPFAEEYRLVRPDGRIVWVLDEASVIEFKGRDHIEGMFQDITARKLAEASVNEQAAHLEEAYEQLRALERVRSDFFVTASHELRTPLTSILGFATTLAGMWDRLSEKDRREFVGTLERQGRRLLRLIEDLTTTAMLDAGQMRATAKHVHLVPLLDRIADDYAPEAGAIGVDVADDVWVLADPGWVRRIVETLVANSLKYGAAPIDVTAAYEGNRVAIDVRDGGPGIPDDIAGSLFTRFGVSQEQERRVQQGFGLGLALARDIARLMGGDVELRSIDAGACFRIVLPAVVAAQRASDDR